MNPYDQIATQFDAHRTSFREKKYLDQLLETLAPKSSILDVGCGTGWPIGAYLLQKGYAVTGVDASPEMLKLARAHLPEAPLILGDILVLDFTPSFAAIVAWDSVFHIRREAHLGLFKKFYRWLDSKGMLLISLGATEWEGTSEMFGHRFFYSGYAPEQSIALLEEAGFSIISWEVDDPSSRGHAVFLARI